MAYDSQKAKVLQQGLAQGLSEDEALAAAGISDSDASNYTLNQVGTPADNPSYGQVEPAGFNIPNRTGTTLTSGSDPEVDDYEEDYEERYSSPPANQIVTTQNTTITTGGGSRTTIVTPTEYQDTAASQIYQAEADRTAAEKAALSAQLRSEGKTGAQVIQDPRYRELSAQQQDFQNAADSTKEPIPGTGTVSVQEIPSTTEIETTYERGTPSYVTENAGDDDEIVQLQQANSIEPEVGNVTTEPTGIDPFDAAAQGISDPPVPTDQELLGISAPAPLTDEQIANADVLPEVFALPPDDEEVAADAAGVTWAKTEGAQRQQVLNAQRKMANNGDWRVRLSLAPGATYLYNDPQGKTGILQPLKNTDGVIFPYTPKIDLNYKADYNPYTLTHSNYKGYFYQGSYVDAVNLTATFTAQDTNEANYLLAVIHFFRSVTKMFYGQDPQRGSPPPLVYLTGLGEYQFSAHPCVVSSFNYSLPSDVDYIRARSTNINGTDLLTRRARQDLPTNPISGAVNRLQNLFSSQGIGKGAISSPPAPPTLGQNQPTYVPTKMDITITLLPQQTRKQMSNQFSLQKYANGDLLKGGFW